MSKLKRAPETVFTEDQKLTCVTAVKDLTGSVMSFIGDTYDDSLLLAFKWEERVNKNTMGRKLTLNNYFKQTHKGKSILVGYSLISRENPSESEGVI